MSKAEPVGAAARFFAALADRPGLSLVMRLSDGGRRSIATLSLDARVSRQAVTKHLRVLERARLVRSAHEGRETRFGLAPDGMAPARAYLDTVAAQWEEALGRLKDFVEG